MARAGTPSQPASPPPNPHPPVPRGGPNDFRRPAGPCTRRTILQWDKSDASQRAQIIADPVSTILGSGLEFGQLTICVLGVLVMTSEYSTGVIRASLLAVPRRIPMLAAKAVVFAALVFVIGECVTFPSF